VTTFGEEAHFIASAPVPEKPLVTALVPRTWSVINTRGNMTVYTVSTDGRGVNVCYSGRILTFSSEFLKI